MKLFIMLTTLLNMYQVKWSNDYFEVELYTDVTQFFEVPSAVLYDNKGNEINCSASYLRGVNRTDLSVVNSQHVKTFRIDYRVFFDEYGLSFDHTITFDVVDKTAPVINDADDIIVVLNSKVPSEKQIIESLDYYDNYYKKEELIVKIKDLNLVNNKIVGNYPITYIIKDPSSNYSYYDCFIKVISQDGPVVKYSAPIIFNYGNVFNYFDYFKITDNTSNSYRVDVDLSLINFTKLGKYHLSLVVTNDHSVSTYIETEFYIVDNEKPKLTISSNKVLNVGNYNEDILKSYIIDVSDNYDSLSVDDVTIKHKIDFNELGKYEVYYEVVDQSNNSVSKTITIEIKDLEKPEITLHKQLVAEVFKGLDFYNYFIFSDNYTNESELDIKFDDKAISYDITGYYYLIIEVTDLSKNKVRERFRLEVRDITSPDVSIINDIIITDFKSKEESFYRRNFSISDNYNKYEEIVLQYDDIVNYNVIGVYVLTINFVDQSNNITTLSVEVYVIDNEPPKLTLLKDNLTLNIGDTKPNYYSLIDYYNDNYTNYNMLNVVVKDYVNYYEVGKYEVVFQLFDSSFNETKKTLNVFIDIKVVKLINGTNIKMECNTNYISGIGLRLSDEVTKLDSFPKTIDTRNPGTYEVIHIAYDKRGNSSEFSQIIEVVATNKVNLQKYTLIIIVNVAMFSYLGYLIYQDKKYINFDNK